MRSMLVVAAFVAATSVGASEDDVWRSAAFRLTTGVTLYKSEDKSVAGTIGKFVCDTLPCKVIFESADGYCYLWPESIFDQGYLVRTDDPAIDNAYLITSEADARLIVHVCVRSAWSKATKRSVDTSDVSDDLLELLR